YPMHSEASAPPPDRKSRLYYVACARRVWGRLPRVCRKLAEFAEDAADRRKDDRRLRDPVSGIAEQLVASCGSDPELVAEVVEGAGAQLDAILSPGSLPVPADPETIPGDWDGLA